MDLRIINASNNLVNFDYKYIDHEMNANKKQNN
jgi:hypothetical protein